MNALKKLAGQTAIYGMGTIVPRLLNYLLTPFYTRILLEGEYGTVTELYAYVAFLMVLLTYGMETTYFRYASGSDNPNKVYGTALSSIVVTTALFLGLTVMFAGDIAALIQYPHNVEYIIYFCLIVSLDAFCAIPFARLRQENRPMKFAAIKIINVSVNIGFNIIFFLLIPYIVKHFPDSFVASVFSGEIKVGYVFISNLIASVVTLVLLYKEIFTIPWIFNSTLLKEMLKYAMPLLVVGLAGMVNEVSDKILLKYLWPDQANAMVQVGIYGANYKLAVLMTLFIQMFRYAAEPFFFSQAKEKDAEKTYADVMKYFVLFGLFIFLLITLYIDVVKYFIGDKFRDGLKIVPIVLLANLFLGVFYNLSVWYKLKNMTRFGAYIALGGAAITVLVNALFIPLLGYVASAWGHFLCYFFMMITSWLIGRKYYPIPYPIKRLAVASVIAMALYSLSFLVTVDNLVLKLFINSLFLLAFLAYVGVSERKALLHIK